MKKLLFSILTISILTASTGRLDARHLTPKELSAFTAISVTSLATTVFGEYNLFKGISGSLNKTISGLLQAKSINGALVATYKALQHNSNELTRGSILTALGFTIFKPGIIHYAIIGAEHPRTITPLFEDLYLMLMGCHISQ